MKKTSPSTQQRALVVLTRSGPPAAFALALAAQLAALALIDDGDAHAIWRMALSGLGLGLTAAVGAIALIGVTRSREQAARTQKPARRSG